LCNSGLPAAGRRTPESISNDYRVQPVTAWCYGAEKNLQNYNSLIEYQLFEGSLD